MADGVPPHPDPETSSGEFPNAYGLPTWAAPAPPDDPDARTQIAGTGRAAPDDLVLLHVAEAAEDGQVATQRWLARELRASQPSVSRSLRRLEARHAIRVHVASLRSPGLGERAYALTPAGSKRLNEVRDGLRGLRWPGSEIALGDLEATFGVRRLSSLFEAMRQGGPLEVLLSQFGTPESTGGSEARTGETVVPLVGRLAERLRLVRHLRRLKTPEARGEVLLFVGPPGVGKTRLLQFAQEFARERSVRVVAGRPLSGYQRVLFSPFEEMLAHRRTDSPLPAPVAARSGGPASAPPRRGTSRAARLLRYLDRIEAMAREGPLLLVIDDLELCGPSALQVFDFLSANLPRLELPVVLLAASQDQSRAIGMSPRLGHDPIPALLDRLDRSGSRGVEIVRLGALSAAESRALVDVALGGELPAASTTPVLRRLLARARGNPFFLLESVRELRESGKLAPTAPSSARGRPGAPPPLSANVRRFLAARLAGLAPADRRLLEVAACIGDDFEVAPLQALASRRGGRSGPRDVSGPLRRIAERGEILRPNGPGRYAFTHVLYREVLEESLPDRHRWAASLAQWWEHERSSDVLTIARLYYAAGDADRGLPWIDRALEEVVEHQAYENAEIYVRAAHDLLERRPKDRLARAEREIALAGRLWALGAARAAQGVLEVVLSAPLPRLVRWEGEAMLLNTLTVTAPGEGRSRYEALASEMKGLGPRAPDRLVGERQAVGSFLQAQAGDWERSLELAESAIRKIRVDDWIWSTWARVARSTALLSLGRWFDVIAACREDRARFRDERHAPFLALLDNIEGRVHLVLGDPERAWRCFESGFRLANRIGNAAVLGSLIANRAGAEVARGKLADARASIDALLDLSVKFDFPVHAAWARYRLGQVLWAEGRFHEADRTLAATQREFEQLGLTGPALLPQVYRALRDARTGRARAGADEMLRLDRSLEVADADERALLPREALEIFPRLRVAAGGAAPTHPTAGSARNRSAGESAASRVGGRRAGTES